eukprot:3451432-Amphidinium_carterae.1
MAKPNARNAQTTDSQRSCPTPCEAYFLIHDAKSNAWIHRNRRFLSRRYNRQPRSMRDALQRVIQTSLTLSNKRLHDFTWPTDKSQVVRGAKAECAACGHLCRTCGPFVVVGSDSSLSRAVCNMLHQLHTGRQFTFVDMS